MAHIRYYDLPDTDSLFQHMQRSGVNCSVNLPVITRPDQTPSVNEKMIRESEEYSGIGIINFGGIHPEYEDWKTELRRLKEAGIRGIKLHPAYQNVELNDIRYKRIIEFATELDLIVLTHAGLDVGYLNHNFVTIPMILDMIRDVAPTRFVLAHMGSWQGWEEVKKDLAGAPVWLDTAFSLGKIEARESEEKILQYPFNLTHEAFRDLVRAHGADKILFASDYPWADQKEYAAFIQDSGLSEKEKEKIFFKNAADLLKLE